MGQDVDNYSGVDEAQKSLLASAFFFSPLPMSITNREGFFEYINPKFTHVTGYTLDELKGQTSRVLKSSQTPLSVYKDLWSTILDGRTWSGEICNRKKNGEEFWESISIHGIKDVRGTITHFVSAWQDITTRKKYDESEKRLKDKLEKSNQELETFAFIASHDLQEPLCIILMYLEILAERNKGKLDKESDEFISIAKEGAKRSQNLIRDLLEYAKAGGKEKEFEKIHFGSALKQAISNLQLAIQDSGALITQDYLPTLKADMSQMVRLFQNLLSNAIKYRGGNPLKIHISAEQKDKEWIFSVKDTGIGIDPQHKDRIFAIFQRLHNKEECAGTGIGLAVCKKIIECHDGKIWVESKSDEGSTFYFTLHSD